MTQTTSILIRKRNGRSFWAGTDWDTGEPIATTDRHAALHFADAAAAKAAAQKSGLNAADWKMVRA